MKVKLLNFASIIILMIILHISCRAINAWILFCLYGLYGIGFNTDPNVRLVHIEWVDLHTQYYFFYKKKNNFRYYLKINNLEQPTKKNALQVCVANNRLLNWHSLTQSQKNLTQVLKFRKFLFRIDLTPFYYILNHEN